MTVVSRHWADITNHHNLGFNEAIINDPVANAKTEEHAEASDYENDFLVLALAPATRWQPQRTAAPISTMRVLTSRGPRRVTGFALIILRAYPSCTLPKHVSFSLLGAAKSPRPPTT